MENFLALGALALCPLFESIPEQEYAAALGCLGARQKSYPRGAYLLREGEAAGTIGVVLKGRAEVLREDADGSRTVQALLEPGDLFAETFAAAGLAALPVSVTAREDDTTALLFPYARLLGRGPEACAWHSQLTRNLLGVLAKKNLILNERLGILARRGLRQRLVAYLEIQAARANRPSFEIPLDRQGLADYLCADRSALSAELSRMRREGLLDYRRSRFTLLWQGGPPVKP